MGNTREEKLKYAFGMYPKAAVLFVTSDDQMFFSRADASAHAKTLDDKEIEEEIRSDYIQSAKSVDDDEDDDDEDELTALREKHKQLFGNLPSHNAKPETIQKKIDEELERLAAVAAKDAENANKKGGEKSGNENPDAGNDDPDASKESNQ